MKYLSLFSGIAGFELGIQKAYESNNRRLLQSETTEDLLGQQPDTPLGQDGIISNGNQQYGNNLCGRDRDTKDTRAETSQQGVETAEQNTQRQRDTPSIVKFRDTGSLSCIGFSERTTLALLS